MVYFVNHVGFEFLIHHLAKRCEITAFKSFLIKLSTRETTTKQKLSTFNHHLSSDDEEALERSNWEKRSL